jgi:predicted phosphodiesterase
VVAGAVKWCAEQLSKDDRDFLEGFKPTLRVDLGGGTWMLCFHGSPKSNTDVILAATPKEELEALLDGRQEAVLIGGHTHIPLLRRHKMQLVINPGSVGEPLLQMPPKDMPQIPPWAEYAVINAVNSAISVEHRRVPVSIDAMHKASAASKNPFNWAELWLRPGQSPVSSQVLLR